MLKRAASRYPLPGQAAKAKAKAQPVSADSTPSDALPGPSTLKEAFAWPADMVKAVCSDPERLRRLKQLTEKSWQVSSDYSGLRTEEVCFQALNQEIGKQLGLELKHSFLYSCACDATCRSLVLGTTGSRKPQHCFKDLNGWLTAEAEMELDGIESMMPKLTKEMTPAERESAETKRAAAYDEMGAWLFKNYSTALRKKNYCLEHMGSCELESGSGSESHGPDHASLAVAGLTCVGWSIMGKHEGFGHNSMRPFFIWCCHQREQKPWILVVESALRFPRPSLEKYLGDMYHLVFFEHSGPVLHGWPVGRPRMYCLGFLRSKLTSVGSQEEYNKVLSRTLQLSGDVFFFLDEDDQEVMNEKFMLALRRCVQFSAAQNLPWEILYPGAKQQIIEEHKKLFHQMCPQPPAYICDLDQNVGFMSAGPVWPCLVRHGTIYSLNKERHATAPELFAAQGFPVHEKCQAPYSCGFQKFFEKGLTQTDSHKLLGNAMFVPTLASMILYALCSAELHSAQLIRPTSRMLSGDFEESQESAPA